MKRTILALSAMLLLPPTVQAQGNNKPVLPKMTLDEFVKQAETQPGFRNGLPPTTLESFKTPEIAEVQSYSEDEALEELLKFLPTMGDIRGGRDGVKEKTLGCYVNDHRVTFKSGYKDVEPRTQCQFAYDLHLFIVKNGGGWDNYRKYLSSKDHDDAGERAHVPYDKQAAFADTWWKKYSQAYKDAAVPFKDWWLHESVLDANNIWLNYEDKTKGNFDYESWKELSEMSQLFGKK